MKASVPLGTMQKVKVVKSNGVQTVQLPDGFEKRAADVFWRKTEEGYLLTTRNEFDELIDELEKNPLPDTIFEERPKQNPGKDRKWWYEE